MIGGVDVTEDCAKFEYSNGGQNSDLFGSLASPSVCGITLYDDKRKYDYFDNAPFQPGDLIELEVGGQVWAKFYCQDWPVQHPSRGRIPLAIVRGGGALDFIKTFRNQVFANISEPEISTGDAVNAILDRCGWTGSRSIADGQTRLISARLNASTILGTFRKAANSIDALKAVVQAELGYLHDDVVQGGIRFDDRTTRVEKFYRTPLVTIDRGVQSDVHAFYDTIINSYSSRQSAHTTPGENISLYSNEKFSIKAGETLRRAYSAQGSRDTYEYINPWTIPVYGSDWTFSGGVGNITMQASPSFTVLYLDFTAKVDGEVTIHQVRGTPYERDEQQLIAVVDAASIQQFGTRNKNVEAQLVANLDATRDFLQSLLYAHARPSPRYSITDIGDVYQDDDVRKAVGYQVGDIVRLNIPDYKDDNSVIDGVSVILDAQAGTVGWTLELTSMSAYDFFVFNEVTAGAGARLFV